MPPYNSQISIWKVKNKKQHYTQQYCALVETATFLSSTPVLGAWNSTSDDLHTSWTIRSSVINLQLEWEVQLALTYKQRYTGSSRGGSWKGSNSEQFLKQLPYHIILWLPFFLIAFFLTPYSKVSSVSAVTLPISNLCTLSFTTDPCKRMYLSRHFSKL